MLPSSIWIGPLWRSAHWVLLYTRAEDYVRFETGEAPDPSTLTEFWTEVPPGGVPADTMHIGLFEKDTIVALPRCLSGSRRKKMPISAFC